MQQVGRREVGRRDPSSRRGGWGRAKLPKNSAHEWRASRKVDGSGGLRLAGRGPSPKHERSRTGAPERGEWTTPTGTGWQHGKTPAMPSGLKRETQVAWRAWMRSWFAAFWTPADLPGLRIVILLYDQVQRGDHHRAAELRLQMDTYGITPKGQQDRRWRPPEAKTNVAKVSRYRRLEAVR
jgi:hypothetical protein